MPIRETFEHIHIHVECSERELPHIMAALAGQQQPSVIEYESHRVDLVELFRSSRPLLERR